MLIKMLSIYGISLGGLLQVVIVSLTKLTKEFEGILMLEQVRLYNEERDIFVQQYLKHVVYVDSH